VEEHKASEIEVFTAPDTLFGATTWCSRRSIHARHHRAEQWPDATLAADFGDMPVREGIFGPTNFLQERCASTSIRFARQARASGGRCDKTGCSEALRRTRRRRVVPIFVADYVLMGYGTSDHGGARARPATDSRRFELPITR
jgi:hypothetical protein